MKIELDNKEIQNQIGEILDLYKLKNIRQLEEKIEELGKIDPESKELRLLRFVVFVYNETV